MYYAMYCVTWLCLLPISAARLLCRGLWRALEGTLEGCDAAYADYRRLICKD